VILVSTSTGGTLSLKLASEDNSIAGLIIYSPFIDLKNPNFKAIITPQGKAGFLQKNKGSEIMKQNRPKEEAKYWATNVHINGFKSLIKIVVNNYDSCNFLKSKNTCFYRLL